MDTTPAAAQVDEKPAAAQVDEKMEFLTQQVIEIIAKTRYVAPEKISWNSTFEELNFDSVDGLEILFSLEEEFGIEIPDETAQQITSVDQIVESLKPLVTGNAGQSPGESEL